MRFKSTFASSFVFFLISVAGLAATPECLDRGTPIDIDNREVLDWKHTTPNQFLARAHVEGRIEQIFPSTKSHMHFEIQLGDDADGTLEVVYNQSFGRLPKLFPGMRVEACGDYITSIAQSGPYPPSPSGAIIHWVHRSRNPKNHESGFLVIEGTLYGY